MTVSGTATFSMTVEEIVTEARELLGVQAAEEPLQAHELQKGIRHLNLLLKSLQAASVMAWTLTEGSFTLVEDDADYVFGTGGTFTTVPIEITDVRIERGVNSIAMTRLSREDYYNLPNRTTSGYPTMAYYDRQRDTGTLYVWPAPDAGLGTIQFTYRRRIMDAGNGTDTLDIPPEWHEAILYGLAKRLIPTYPKIDKTALALVMAMADSSWAIAANFDTGEGMGSLTVTPDYDR